jgi:rhodanese-related sulfurtransferase
MNQKKKNWFAGRGFQIDSIIALSPGEAYSLLKKDAVLVDLRREYETSYRLFDVPSIIYMTEHEIRNDPNLLPGNRPLILADNVGMLSRKIAMKLFSEGYDNIAIISGGIIAWVKDGLPVKKDANYELRGQCSCKLQPVNPKTPGILKKD